MTIYRDGKEYTLTRAEMQEAYFEQEDTYTRQDLNERLGEMLEEEGHRPTDD